MQRQTSRPVYTQARGQAYWHGPKRRSTSARMAVPYDQGKLSPSWQWKSFTQAAAAAEKEAGGLADPDLFLTLSPQIPGSTMMSIKGTHQHRTYLGVE